MTIEIEPVHLTLMVLQYKLEKDSDSKRIFCTNKGPNRISNKELRERCPEELVEKPK